MKKRTGEIEFLRFVFCLFVIMFHCNQKIFRQFSPDRFDYTWAPHGYIGVEFFFILSGFFLAVRLAKINYDNTPKSKLGKTYFQIIWHKYISVFPYHLLAFVPLFVLDNHLKGDYTFDKLLRVLPGLFLVQRTGINSYNVNGVEWYISAMLVAMAVIIPFAVKYKEVYFRYAAPVIAVLVYGYLIREFKTISDSSAWTSIGYRCVWRAVAGINLGIFAYQCTQKLKKYNYSKAERTTAFFVRYILFAVTALYMLSTITKKFEIYIVFVIFIATLLTFVFPIQNKIFQNNLVLFLGRMSLPMYLNQLLAVSIVKEYVKIHSHFKTFAVVCAIDFAVSVLCLFVGDLIKKQLFKTRLNKMIDE
ncbi:MAG: acyltransferase [Ruminococcaceae bacterium]|nr:acyltransferase [Oscillospiraceae bacterium]